MDKRVYVAIILLGMFLCTGCVGQDNSVFVVISDINVSANVTRTNCTVEDENNIITGVVTGFNQTIAGRGTITFQDNSRLEFPSGKGVAILEIGKPYKIIITPRGHIYNVKTD